MAVVQQPVEDRGGDDGIAEHVAPLAGSEIAGDEDAAALVAATDELEHQVSSVGLERQVAELVDDQQLRLGEVQQLVLEPILVLRLGELGKQRRGGGE